MPNSLQNEYYKIKTPFATYFAEIYHQYPNTDKVYIGGKKKCVTISVYKDDINAVMGAKLLSPQQHWMLARVGSQPCINEPPNIDGLGYHSNCNEAGDHQRSSGSIHLLNTAMQFIIMHYKLKDKTFLLKDTSYIECNKGHLPLSIYYMAYHGKTWYEAKFNAVPVLISSDLLQKQKKELKHFLKGKTGINDLKEFFNEKEKPLRDIILKEAKDCKNIKELLTHLKEYDCDIFKNWLSRLVSKFIPNLNGADWQIELNKDTSLYIEQIKDKPIDMFSMNRGGLFRHHP
jgi:hypothetical protein